MQARSDACLGVRDRSWRRPTRQSDRRPALLLEHERRSQRGPVASARRGLVHCPSTALAAGEAAQPRRARPPGRGCRRREWPPGRSCRLREWPRQEWPENWRISTPVVLGGDGGRVLVSWRPGGPRFVHELGRGPSHQGPNRPDFPTTTTGVDIRQVRGVGPSTGRDSSGISTEVVIRKKPGPDRASQRPWTTDPCTNWIAPWTIRSRTELDPSVVLLRLINRKNWLGSGRGPRSGRGPEVGGPGPARIGGRRRVGPRRGSRGRRVQYGHESAAA
jgi:hypothetical protein